VATLTAAYQLKLFLRLAHAQWMRVTISKSCDPFPSPATPDTFSNYYEYRVHGWWKKYVHGHVHQLKPRLETFAVDNGKGKPAERKSLWICPSDPVWAFSTTQLGRFVAGGKPLRTMLEAHCSAPKPHQA
jgi:hypothetical protein